MTTKRLVYIGLLVALSVVLANVKFMGSIALDALPAFFAAIFISPLAGAIIGFLGHLASSLLSGFPFTILIHLMIGALMFITVYVFGAMYKKVWKVLSFALAVLLNGVVSTYLTFFVMGLGSGGMNMPMMYGVMQVVVVASVVNVGLAMVMYELLARRGYEKL